MEEFLKAISNYGFPIVVASYLLFRMEKILGDLTKEVRNLKEAINNLCEKE